MFRTHEVSGSPAKPGAAVAPAPRDAHPTRSRRPGRLPPARPGNWVSRAAPAVGVSPGGQLPTPSMGTQGGTAATPGTARGGRGPRPSRTTGPGPRDGRRRPLAARSACARGRGQTGTHRTPQTQVAHQHSRTPTGTRTAHQHARAMDRDSTPTRV